MGDIAGHSISEVGWSKVRTSLSPASKFDISDPIMMVPKLLVNTKIRIYEFINYPQRETIHIYVLYAFPDYESAACFEFLMRGASLNIHQSIDIPAVSHRMIKGADDPNKLCGVILVSSNTADNLYIRVQKTLMALKATH